MTKEDALKWLDTIMTQGEQVDALEMAIESLESQKTGHWINTYKHNGTTIIAVKCSICGNYSRSAIRSDYCPNCGANMRGE